MAPPLAWEAFAEGDALPSATVATSKLRVLQFVAAGWMWDPAFFWDPDAAADTGLPGPILPGPYKHVLVQQYLLHWCGRVSALRRVQVSHRRPDLHEGELTFGGVVVRKYEDGGRRFADVEVHVDQASGERCLRGSATLEF